MYMHIHKSRRHNISFRVYRLNLMPRKILKLFRFFQIFPYFQDFLPAGQNVADLPHARFGVNT